MSEESFPITSVNEVSEPGSRVITEVNGVEIAVVNIDNKFYAITNYCIHEGGPLCEGPMNKDVNVDDDGFNYTLDDEEYVVHCPWHNWRFKIKDGVCADDDRYLIPTYETFIEDGTIHIKT